MYPAQKLPNLVPFISRAKLLSMKFITPVDNDYLQSLGRATYNFAYLESQMVWVANKLKPGFVMSVRRLTAGRIAKKITDLVSLDTVPIEARQELISLASSFESLVERRNKLVHANPCTASDGKQRLTYSGPEGILWQIEDIEQFALDCEVASRIGNVLYYGILKDLASK